MELSATSNGADERTNEWLNVWLDEWTNEWITLFIDTFYIMLLHNNTLYSRTDWAWQVIMHDPREMMDAEKFRSSN